MGWVSLAVLAVRFKRSPARWKLSLLLEAVPPVGSSSCWQGPLPLEAPPPVGIVPSVAVLPAAVFPTELYGRNHSNKAVRCRDGSGEQEQGRVRESPKFSQDGSGELSKGEFANLMSDTKFMTKMKILDIETHDLPDIFRICDDGDGAVTAVEFCTGLMRMLKVPSALDVMGATRTGKALEKSMNFIIEHLAQGVLKYRIVMTLETMKAIEQGVGSSKH